MENISEAEYLVRKLLILEVNDLSSAHHWQDENERWQELVFALLTRVLKRPEAELRLITEQLKKLGLLEISRLTTINGAELTKEDEQYTARIMGFMEECGLTREEGTHSLQVIRAAAHGLAVHYDGKVQKYLRRYGDQMLNDVPHIFQFTGISDEDVKYAFTFWLQNILNMPISLIDTTVISFCDASNITIEELLQAADRLDINAALLDDLIHLFEKRRLNKSESPPSK